MHAPVGEPPRPGAAVAVGYSKWASAYGRDGSFGGPSGRADANEDLDQLEGCKTRTRRGEPWPAYPLGAIPRAYTWKRALEDSVELLAGDAVPALRTT